MSETLPAAISRRFRSYPDYRPSAVQWCQYFPAHWTHTRGKVLFRRMKRHVRDNDDVVTAFRDGTVTLRKNRREEGFTFSIKEIGYQGVRTGDLVIHSMDGFAGAIGVSDSDGKSTPVYLVCTPHNSDSANPDYYAYLLRFLAWNGFILSLAKGIRERSTSFGFREFGELYYPNPSFEEQETIVAFLDHHTAVLDNLINEKRKLIDLLQEKRTALISHAVTKGLNPDAPMKESGVPWIGRIPSHWEVQRLKFACRINPTKSEISTLSKDLLVTFLPMEKIGENGELILDENRTLEQVWDGFTYFREGDVVIAKITPSFENGKGATCFNLKNGIGFGTTELHVLRPASKYDAKYLYYLVHSHDFRTLGTSEMYGVAGQQRVPSAFVENYTIGFPPLSEERIIVDYIASKAHLFDQQIVEISEGIKLLREYLKALISAAVTGKIDVRSWQASDAK